jgi:hypothetical protein
VADLAAGTLLNQRYRIVKPIGVGGMGAVDEAVDARLQNSVADSSCRPETGHRPAARTRCDHRCRASQRMLMSIRRLFDRQCSRRVRSVRL